MLRNFVFSIDEYYHVYNRGTDKRIIFTNEHDYRRFVVLLYLCNDTKSIDVAKHFQEGRSFMDLFNVKRGDQIVDIGAYALMPNHFHLLLHERTDGGISTFMKKLCTAYVMYFNKKYVRTGPLFEGRFKAKHADSDEYLKYLFAYIHLNPVDIVDSGWKKRRTTERQVTEKYLREYRYSSYVDYVEIGKKNGRLEKNVLNMEAFPEYFSEESFGFEEYVKEWLSFDENNQVELMKDRPS